MCTPWKPSSTSKVTFISVNIHGFFTCKQDLCQQHYCHVLCMQKTHTDSYQNRPQIQGRQFLAERPHWLQSTTIAEGIEIDILTVEVNNCTVTSVYKTPHIEITANQFCSIDTQNIFVVGDFNSHIDLCGYKDDQIYGEAVILSVETNSLTLLLDIKLPASFNGARWRRGYKKETWSSGTTGLFNKVWR